ncbi:RNA polymerase sigma-F factor [bioreactor metagenome]|uniref:RNA polymerase sigma-F factor n=1 Tax=bioreactor metagenome TaxID=1076179 RepID=A0A645BB23_9ZZZZ
MDTDKRSLSLEDAAAHFFIDGGEAARGEVVKAAYGLIRYYANFYGGACDREDLFQTGCLAVLKALARYDPARNVRFTTYASHCILGEIRHLVRSESSYYRPGCIKELQYRVDTAMEEYVKEFGEPPSSSFLAKTLNVREASIREVMRAGLVSFEEIDTSQIHSLAYQSFQLPIEDKLTLEKALPTLSALQQRVVEMLYFGNLTQQEAALKLGLTQRKISRIKEETLKALRRELEKGKSSDS